jgi:hypothetical protein
MYSVCSHRLPFLQVLCIPFRTINAAEYSFVTDKGNEVILCHREGVVSWLDKAFTVGSSLGRGLPVFLGKVLG